MRFRYILIPVLLLISLMNVVAQETDNLQLTLLDEPIVDNSNGTVTVRFIVTDDGVPIVDLTSDAVTLGEASENISLQSNLERQLTLAIAVDLSAGSDADLVADTLRAFADTYYLPQDSITFYILDAGAATSEEFRVVPVTSEEVFDTVIESLLPSEQFFSVEPALNQIFEDFQTVPDTLFNSRQVLYVGSFFNRPSDTGAIVDFSEAGITVHGVQAHRTRQDSTRIYRGLTNRGGGLFANNVEGIFVIPGDSYQPINNLKVLYDTIANSRVVYTLTWVTRNPSLDSNRNIEIELQAPDGSGVTQTVDYIFDFLPPDVSFINQASFDIIRPINRIDNFSVAYGVDERSVPVQVTFPDGVARSLDSLRLEIIDITTQEILQSDLLLSPESPDNEYLLIWNLENFTTPDSVTDIQLIVTAIDELGLSATTTINGSITLPSLPPTTTPIPTNTAIPTETPVATATPVDGAVIQQADGNQRNAGNNVLSPLIIALIGIILVLIIILIYLVIRTNRIQSTGGGQMPVPAHSVELDTRPPLAAQTGPGEAQERTYAQLVALDETGAELGFEQLFITRLETTIGRNESCDIILDTPILDNRHCVIIVKNNNMIYIRDLSSINGTFVNGERLHENETFLPMNTEFSLTRKLKFKLLSADAMLKEDDRLSTIAKSTVYSSKDNIPFKKVDDKLTYAEDDGPPIDEDYSPL